MEHFRTVTADRGDRGLRLDRFLASKLPDLSRARIQALLGAGEICRDGAVIAEGSHRVKPGERFVVRLPPPAPATPEPEAIPLDILYEDHDLVILDKPAGLVVHPAAGHDRGTLVNALLAHCQGSLSGIGGVQRPGIVHRLDKDVSGVMVVAKHDRAHVRLAAQFSVHRIERAYEAIVWRVPPTPSGSIDRPIGRHPSDRKRMAVVSHGKRALSHYRLLQAAGTLAARLNVELATGRTHQIRVHLSSLGLGIVGDPVYRFRHKLELSTGLRHYLAGFNRIALHAWRLGFEHPMSGVPMSFDHRPPPDFDQLFERLQMEFVSFTIR